MEIRKTAIPILLLLCFFASSLKTKAQPEPGSGRSSLRFVLNLKTEDGVSLPLNFQDTLNKVNLLLNRVFSSAEFRDSLYAHSFNDSSYSKSASACFKKEINGQTHRIEGRAVYENLTSDSLISLDLLVKATRGTTRTQGFSNACIFKVTSNDYWMHAKQPLAYRYTRHIAHEYTHIRGFRHDTKVAEAYKWGRSPDEDPAYGVGRIVGNILERWARMNYVKL